MVVQILWKNLKNLMAIDLEASEITQKLAQANALLEKEQAKIPKIQEDLALKRYAYITAQKNVAAEELRAQELKDQETKDRADLEKIKTHKEYEALSRELKKTVEDRITHEETLISAWHQLDSAQKDFETATAAASLQKSLTEEHIQTHRNSVRSFQSQLNEIQQKRATMALLIPPEWLEKYERMRTQVADPIVPIAGSSCSACFYPILLQDLNRILKNATLPCHSCYRLLYHDKQEE